MGFFRRKPGREVSIRINQTGASTLVPAMLLRSPGAWEKATGWPQTEPRTAWDY